MMFSSDKRKMAFASFAGMATLLGAGLVGGGLGASDQLRGSFLRRKQKTRGLRRNALRGPDRRRFCRCFFRAGAFRQQL